MSLADKLKGIDLDRKCPVPLRPELLLAPNVPKPLHRTAPRTVLGQAWWDRERAAAYALTDNHCLACGVHKSQTTRRWMEGHEVYDIDYRKGRAVYVETVALCTTCHEFIHDGRLQAMMEKGEITKHRYQTVMLYGATVLAKAGLKKPEPPTGKIAGWSAWRLVVDGVEHKGKYKNYDEWLKDHNL